MPPLSLAELLGHFLAHLDRQVKADQVAPLTAAYYRRHLSRAAELVGGGRQVEDLKPLDYLRTGLTSWHDMQAWQRLFNWALKAGWIDHHPFGRLEKPTLGQRTRTLTADQWRQLLAVCRPPLARFLRLQRLTLARPGEVRALRWDHIDADAGRAVLHHHKTRRRVQDRRPRVIVLNEQALALIADIRSEFIRKGLDLTGAVLRGHSGRAWTTNSLRLAVRRAVRRAGLDGPGERIVAYTIRHTGATQLTADGVRDRQLADLMGHSQTRTTARYQHLDVSHLRAAAARIAA